MIGAGAAGQCAADGSNLEINCGMAQAFEIPTEDWMAPEWIAAGKSASSARSSLTRFQITAPVRTNPSDGSMMAIWVRGRLAASAQISTGAAGGRLEARFGDHGEVNQSRPI
jgi:hypothetical protein